MIHHPGETATTKPLPCFCICSCQSELPPNLSEPVGDHGFRREGAACLHASTEPLGHSENYLEETEAPGFRTGVGRYLQVFLFSELPCDWQVASGRARQRGVWFQPLCGLKAQLHHLPCLSFLIYEMGPISILVPVSQGFLRIK